MCSLSFLCSCTAHSSTAFADQRFGLSSPLSGPSDVLINLESCGDRQQLLKEQPIGLARSLVHHISRGIAGSIAGVVTTSQLWAHRCGSQVAMQRGCMECTGSFGNQCPDASYRGGVSSSCRTPCSWVSKRGQQLAAGFWGWVGNQRISFCSQLFFLLL